MREDVRTHRDHVRACRSEAAVPEFWEQEGVRCSWSCLRGDIQEELKNAPVLRHKPDQPWRGIHCGEALSSFRVRNMNQAELKSPRISHLSWGHVEVEGYPPFKD